MRLSWRARLILLFTLVLSVSLLFQLFYVIPAIQSREVALASDHQVEIASHIARELDIDLLRIKNRLTRIAARAEFRAMDAAGQTRTMEQHIEISKLLAFLVVMDAEGSFVSGAGEILPDHTTTGNAGEPCFAVPFEQGEVYFSPAWFQPREGIVGTSVSVPIETEAGERIGVLLGGMSLNELIEEIEGYPLDDGQVAFVVDGSDTAVAHSGIDMSALEAGPLSLNFSDQPLVQAMATAKADRQMGGGEEHLHGVISTFGSFAVLESNGWRVVVEAPMVTILARSSALAVQLVQINIGIYVVILIVTLVITRRITSERKRAEIELKESHDQLEHRTEELEAVNRELETFSYSVSHDLRAPLRHIEGFGQALVEDCAGKLDERAKDYLQRIIASSKRAGQLVADLLRFSRLTGGELSIGPVDLSALARKVAEKLQGSKPQRKVGFEIAAGLAAEADERLTQIVLENLLDNAWKFTGKTKDARIEIGTAEREGKREFFVRDNGIGFDPAEADKLFVAFQRLHTGSEFEGTGIGLATVQRIVHRHGGRVRAEGEAGKGATFYFTLG